ncbi:protein of unknown function (plasmid) [Cupriavidus taiwanensis]|uniref:Uncharacterized protein n=1 Tax=Cupriavidus taiwanensis TaxID=164546 RepID=A0A9Q7UZG5_9BURK|nr:protein of unknown function [Cupriavidus taiwanensis]
MKPLYGGVFGVDGIDVPGKTKVNQMIKRYSSNPLWILGGANNGNGPGTQKLLHVFFNRFDCHEVFSRGNGIKKCGFHRLRPLAY